MPAETGDIVFFPGKIGHIGMFYDANRIIHATNSENFHLSDNQTMDGGSISYMTSRAFRPPWSKLPAGQEAVKKAELRRVADRMKDIATYGLYRAFRLWAGNSSFGPGAEARLAKYRARLDGTATDADRKFVTHITCSEAVMLTYQLAFPDREAPFFIRLDAAHTMPNTLADWLQKNGWTAESV
ncbi:hypothetical protein [Azospirillum sp. TSO35-2]|uniref:hypothetical protein n=1 Tax=Azospirillum sp. TSO35-2 TaxID=716796 RepID=UPI000D60F5B7|nr:hypothetical protein [Azospirillum sp. TSO35-2]PWC35904.1 hypothetical protein TSO352_11835 [Azospirillum sp. TSO35-2]